MEPSLEGEGGLFQKFMILPPQGSFRLLLRHLLSSPGLPHENSRLLGEKRRKRKRKGGRRRGREKHRNENFLAFSFAYMLLE